VGEMAACIKANVEALHNAPAAEPSAEGSETASDPRPAAPVAAMATAKPVNAFGLLFSVFWQRIRRVFGGAREA